MAIDLVKLHDVEQKVVAAMTFVTSHMKEIQQMKEDVADLFKQVAALRSESASKKDYRG